MNGQRTRIVIPRALAGEIDRLVGKRGRNGFLALAVRRELKRLRMFKALERAAGSWRDEDHPGLKTSAARWVRSLRQEDERLRQSRTPPTSR